MADRDDSQLASNLGWFALGTVVGLGAAVLLAPQSGKDTRRFLGDKTTQGREAIADTGKDVFDRSKDMVEKGRQLVEDAADLFERGRKLVRGEE